LDDQAVPLGVELAGDVESLDQTGFMTAVTLGINALEARDRRLVGGDGRTWSVSPVGGCVELM
jgi:hypothetical protein